MIIFFCIFPPDILFHPLSSGSENVLGWVRSLYDKRLLKWAKEQAPEQQIDSEDDLNYLRGLDPVEWKEQDHYRVIGIRHLRERASEDDIKRSCK